MKKLFLLILFIGGAIWGAKSEGLFGDPCDMQGVEKKVEKIYVSLEGTDEGRAMFKNIDTLIKKGTVNAADREKLIRTNLKLAVLTKSECEIPPSLKSEITASYQSNPNGKQCPKNIYRAQAQSEIAKLKSGPNYLAVEQQAYQQIAAQLSSSAGKERLANKWKDDGFRQRMMLSVMQIGLRQQSQCANVALPMGDILQEFMN